MTVPFKNRGHFLIGFRVGSRRPPAPEMMIVVRALYDIGTDGTLTLRASSDITEEHVAEARELDAKAGHVAEEARMRLGQGTLKPETYRDDDERMLGELVYPGDFAVHKLNAEVVARGSCHAARDATEAEVEISVGDWKKALKVVGTRVRTDDVAGGHVTAPQPIGVMAVDYAHAYGGPGFAANRVGKGHTAPPTQAALPPGADEEEAEIYQPPRSQRSQVMPSKQLANVLHADGSELKNGLPAGFGPLGATHPHRSQYIGKKYGGEWLEKRAPFMAEDFDSRYDHVAPPDQQLKGYLRGDESVSFKNFHGHRARLSTKLPGVRVRIFVIDDRDDVREATMHLDTLFADLDDSALYLTWRGHTPVREEDLTDIRYGWCALESLTDEPLPFRHYEEQLRALAADPTGMADAFPAEFMEMAERAERVESASDEELERMADACMESNDPGGPLGAAMRMLFGSALDETPADTLDQIELTHEGLSRQELRDKVLETLRSTSGSAGASLDLDNGTLQFPAGGAIHQVRAGLDQAEQQQGLDAESAHNLAAQRERLDAIDIQAIDPTYDPKGSDDEPGPGANLGGRDLSNLDLRGVDLTGADLRSAVLSRTNLEGCTLVDAKLRGAHFFRTRLEGADLTGADLASATFRRAFAMGARLDRARLDMTRFEQTDLSGASLREATGRMSMLTKTNLDRVQAAGLVLEKALFDECSLVASDLSKSRLVSCTFKECNARNLCLDGAAIENSAFHMCDAQGLCARGVTGELSVWMRTKLEGADFGMASLPAAHFMLVEAAGASFVAANIPGARFDRAVLKRCCFDGAKLSHSNLRHAVLSKATFVKASLYDAKLMQSFGEDVDLGGANLERANFHRSQLTRR